MKVCQAEQIDAYIPDIHYRTRDPRFAEQERFKDGLHPRQRPAAKPRLFTVSDFSFDPDKELYRCPQGKELTCHARPEDCAACPVKTRCLSKPTTSRRYLSVPVNTQSPNLIDEMKAKIESEEGKRVYARRLGIVEPVFANICVQQRMHRFTLPSKQKVDVQWTRTRFALVHNIGKIHTFGAISTDPDGAKHL